VLTWSEYVALDTRTALEVEEMITSSAARPGHDAAWFARNRVGIREAFTAAVTKLRAALALGDQGTSWEDHLPEAPELPIQPDEVVAVVIPRRRRRLTAPRR
jgi:hypothetical protein